MLPYVTSRNLVRNPKFNTNKVGQSDRLWVIGTVTMIFLSSSTLVLLAWICKGNKKSNSHSDQGNNSKASKAVLERSNFFAQEIHPSLEGFNHQRSMLDRGETSLMSSRGKLDNSCDFLIIGQPDRVSCDPKVNPMNRTNSTTAILLVDPTDDIELQGFRGTSLKGKMDAETRFHLGEIPGQDYTHFGGPIGIDLPSECLCFETHRDRSESGRVKFGHSRVVNLSPYRHASGQRLICAGPGCNGFELNSQGELTMTDESSSFVHDETLMPLSSSDCRHMANGEPDHRASPPSLVLRPSSQLRSIRVETEPTSFIATQSTSPNSSNSSTLTTRPALSRISNGRSERVRFNTSDQYRTYQEE